jgi:hypothetical protein
MRFFSGTQKTLFPPKIFTGDSPFPYELGEGQRRDFLKGRGEKSVGVGKSISVDRQFSNSDN